MSSSFAQAHGLKRIQNEDRKTGGLAVSNLAGVGRARGGYWRLDASGMGHVRFRR